MSSIPSSPPPLATDPASGSSVPARLRIVTWTLFVVALGLTSMIVSVRSTLMADISRSANTDVTHEVKELQNFASTGVDPRTSQPFTSTTRLMEVYRDGQQLTDREAVIIYNHATGQATQASGASAPTLEPTSTDPLFVKLLQSPSGATDYGSGEVRWARVELEPDDPSQHLSVITMSFTASRVDQLNATIWLMVGISAAVLVLTGIIGLLVARQILRPLRDLRTAAASVSTQDLNRRLPVKGRDDIAGLTEEFNGMLDRLQEAFDGQTQFVLRAHQEISGPLAVMDARLASQPATRTVLQQRTQIAELQRVLDDLQSLTQAERRDFAHPTPDVEVTELARTLLDDVEAMAPGRWRFDLRVQGTATLDVERVRQATGHLARNGLQHGDGPLTLTIAPGTDGYGRSGLEISGTGRRRRRLALRALHARRDRRQTPRRRAGSGHRAGHRRCPRRHRLRRLRLGPGGHCRTAHPGRQLLAPLLGPRSRRRRLPGHRPLLTYLGGHGASGDHRRAGGHPRRPLA